MTGAQSRIRAFGDGDLAEIPELSLLAWDPAFESMEKVLGSRVFHLIWPDWREMSASLPDVDRAQRQAERVSEAPVVRPTSTTPWWPSSTAAWSGSSPTS